MRRSAKAMMTHIIHLLFFIVAITVLPTALLVRLIGAIFFQASRDRIKERPLAHAGWFVMATLPVLYVVFHLLAVRSMIEQQDKRRPNQASEATSEPAPGAVSSSPQG